MKKAILIALVCVMVVAALAGCGGGSKPEDAVVGKWDVVVSGTGTVLDFKADGTFDSIKDDGETVQGGGTYTVEGDHISFYRGEKKWMNF